MIAVLMALAASTPAPAAFKTFKDWIVGCDNGLACQADGVMPEDESVAATIAVKRGAEAEAVPEIWFRIEDGTPADIVADSSPLHLHLASREDVFDVAPADSMRLVTALASAKSLSVVDSAGKEIAIIAPSGAAAALLYMDDRQHRVGTATALVRKGEAAASSMPLPPALPTIFVPTASGTPPVTLNPATIRSIRGEDSCEDAGREEEPEYDRLDERSTLALIPEVCASGAYNFAFAAMIVGNDGKYREAKFDDANVGGDGTFNAEWDAGARALQTGMKGRGIGDCGVWSAYAWDGKRFRLIEQKLMDDCRGSIDFITTWRTKALERH